MGGPVFGGHFSCERGRFYVAHESFGIEKAAHRIELAEVKRENLDVLSFLAVWGGMNVTGVVNATQNHGFESPDFIRMAPTANPGLPWVLSYFNTIDDCPHSMFLIVIVAFLATVGFFRRAKEVGIHPGKAASIPLIAAGLMLAVTYLSAFAIGRVFSAMNVSVETARWPAFAMHWFLVLAYLIFIKRNWDTLSAAKCRDLASGESATKLDTTA